MTNALRKVIFMVCAIPATINAQQLKESLPSESLPKAIVELEWELVPQAVSYEIEFKDANGKTQVLTSQKNSVNGEFTCGHYNVRARTINTRKVLGVWGDLTSFDIPLKQAKPLVPKENSKITTNQERTAPVEFEWENFGKGLTYQVKVFNDEKLITSTKTSDSKAKLALPTGKRYTWTVSTVKAGCKPEKTEKLEPSFDLIGTLSAPSLTKDEFEVKWSKPPFAETFDYTVELKKSTAAGTTWKKIVSKTNVRSAGFAPDRTMELGTYRITVTARGPLRQNSKTAELIFDYTHPRSLETRLEFMGAYIPAKKQLSITANSEKSGIDTYLLYNYMIWVAAFYKDKGIFFQYQNGEKKLALANETTSEVVTFKFSVTRADVGLEYDYYYRGYGIAGKLYVGREDTNIFTFSGPNISEYSETVTLLGGEIGPKIQLFFLQLHGYYAYETLLYSQPYRLSPYDQYGAGGEGEFFLNDYISFGFMYRYNLTVFNYSDANANSFLNRITTSKLGGFLKYTLH